MTLSRKKKLGLKKMFALKINLHANGVFLDFTQAFDGVWSSLLFKQDYSSINVSYASIFPLREIFLISPNLSKTPHGSMLARLHLYCIHDILNDDETLTATYVNDTKFLQNVKILRRPH